MPLRDKLLKLNLDGLASNRRELLPGWSQTYLRRLGVFDFVIDVGVLDGTKELYEAFPNSTLVLVEALPEYAEILSKLVADHPAGGSTFSCAAVSSNGSVTFNVVKADPRLSGRHESTLFQKETLPITVDGFTLDNIIEKAGLTAERKGLIKIDTEGGELDVLKGLSEKIDTVDTIICEASIGTRHVGSYEFSDLVDWMARNNFRLFDIMTVTRVKALFPGARIADCVWKRIDP